MCIFLLTLLAASAHTCAANPSIQQRFLNPDAVLRQLFEIMRQTIKSGDPENGVPVLDPMTFYKEEVIITTSLLSLKANLTDGIIRGLGDFLLKSVKIIPDNVAIDFELAISKLIIESDNYEMKGLIFDAMPFSGKGDLRFQIKNLQISSRIYLKPSENGKSALIEKIEDLQFSAQEIVSHTEFDGNMDCIFNNIIKDVIASYFTRFNKYIANTYSPGIKRVLNRFLNKFDSWRIIASLL